MSFPFSFRNLSLIKNGQKSGNKTSGKRKYLKDPDLGILNQDDIAEDEKENSDISDKFIRNLLLSDGLYMIKEAWKVFQLYQFKIFSLKLAFLLIKALVVKIADNNHYNILFVVCL